VKTKTLHHALTKLTLLWLLASHIAWAQPLKGPLPEEQREIIQYLDNGLSIVVVGQTPEAVKVAQNHARIVTGFTEEGSAAVRNSHLPSVGSDAIDPGAE
jgi:hypothetical protein